MPTGPARAGGKVERTDDCEAARSVENSVERLAVLMAVMMVVVLVDAMVVLCRREKTINENEQGLVWKRKWEGGKDGRAIIT